MPDMDQIYAWTETDADGNEGVIAVLIPEMIATFGPLQHRRLDIALRFEPIARKHAEQSGHSVRLVRFIRAEVVMR